ncbi:glutamate receptor ionotropic, delta-1-like [Procambarus clarkii]|uniref:glutamate receptor ionotropic, delta-1-like n=1 Tax=Procambarus clarkii TaxID=6728 RepID=UPI0037427AE3
MCKNSDQDKIYLVAAVVEASSCLLIYRRCLYCNNGQNGVQVILHNYLNFPELYDTILTINEDLQDMRGHKFLLTTRPYFPYCDYYAVNNKPEALVILKDSLDTRILNIFAMKLNFSYEVREAPGRAFGDEKSRGQYTGMIGQLQREEADFSTIIAPTAGRLRFALFARIYPSDKMVITSLKPEPLPASLAIIRPFAGELWVALLMSVGAWGVSLWLLQRAWQWVVGGREEVDLITSLLYGYGALLQNLPSDPTISISGRVMMAWWLVFCLVISTGYNSSLIAHLTVQGMTQSLDTFQDLLNQRNWRWGTEPWQFSGATLEYFSKNPDPVVKAINSAMEWYIVDTIQSLDKVLEGQFSFISVKNYVKVFVESWYTNDKGETPLYISNNGIYVLACFGWAFRKGVPFYERFNRLVSRLDDAGITDFWTNEVIARRVKENRDSANLDILTNLNQNDKDVVLSLHHLQGAFYLLLVGSIVAFLALLGENLAHYWSSPQ